MNDEYVKLKRQVNAAWNDLVRNSWLLIAHEDVCWDDLLASLDTYECITERAAFRLHDAFGKPVKDGLLTRRADWEPLLKSQGVDPKSRVRDFTPPKAF